MLGRDNQSQSEKNNEWSSSSGEVSKRIIKIEWTENWAVIFVKFPKSSNNRKNLLSTRKREKETEKFKN